MVHLVLLLGTQQIHLREQLKELIRFARLAAIDVEATAPINATGMSFAYDEALGHFPQ